MANAPCEAVKLPHCYHVKAAPVGIGHEPVQFWPAIFRAGDSGVHVLPGKGPAAPLAVKQITVIADADEPGRKHAQQVAASFYRKAESVKVLEFPHAKDLSEWAAMGGTRDALLELIRATRRMRSASCR